MRLTRRSLLRQALAGVALGGGSSSFAASLVPVLRGQTDSARMAQLVQLLVQTPRDHVLEAVAGEIRAGADYLDVLAALMLAGVREVQPRPSVGFKFHTVLAVISYHLIATNLPAQDRWLPIFWGIDYFKVAQAGDEQEGNWRQGPVDEASVPTAEKACESLVDALQRWDESAADSAAAAVARHIEMAKAFELFYPFGARDFRSIGHKAIFVMCAQRTLELIGWQHAEPILRSLAYALLMHEGGNPAERDDPADRPWRQIDKLVVKTAPELNGGPPDREVSTRLLGILRTGSDADAIEAVMEHVKRGASISSVWDGIHCGAAELQLRAPNIVSLHAVTTTHAIHFAFQTTGDARMRRMLMLQNAAMIPLFRDAAAQRGQLQDAPIDQLEPILPAGSDDAVILEICRNFGGQRRKAAQGLLGYLQSGRPAAPLVARIQQLISQKGNSSHDFKFASAAIEGFRHVSDGWRGHCLAAGAMHFRGLDERDSAIVARTRAALG
ncbi:MAG: hypothetical protein FJ276_12845 [Planctomycetes bacterium]|nr:hypothetical protein [Planctomycetota bacterium]